MSNLRIFQAAEDIYEVVVSSVSIGTVKTSKNPFHTDHCYISLFLHSYDKEIAQNLFEFLRSKENKPLQAMLYSDNHAETDFLLAGGFTLKRRCLEVEITSADLYVTQPFTQDFCIIRKGDSEYEECCRRVFEYYKQTHQNINRLTASFEEFCADLPETVLCDKKNGMITHLAFTERAREDCEIAYLHSNCPDGFSAFGERLLFFLAQQSSRVYFECDDCDEHATTLRTLTKITDGATYNTYILE